MTNNRADPAVSSNDASSGLAESAIEHLYTTPPNTWASPYGPTPHTFFDMTLITMIARAPAGALTKMVPYPLECSGDYFAASWARCSVHAKNESYVYRNFNLLDFAIPVTYRGLKGRHSTLEYIDLSMGQVVGRELWGFSKKRGTVDWQQTAGGFNLKCTEETGIVLAESEIFFAPEGSSQAASPPGPAGLQEFLDGPYLQVLVSRRLGTDTAVRVDVLRIETLAASGGVSRPTPSFREASGTLVLRDGPLDPLTRLGPIEVVGVRVDFDVSFDFPHGVPIGSAKPLPEQF